MEDEQLNIYKAEGQIAFVIVPKCPPTVSELQRDDEDKTVKQMFCFILIISEGRQACQVKYFFSFITNYRVCVCSHTYYILVLKYSFY